MQSRAGDMDTSSRGMESARERESGRCKEDKAARHSRDRDSRDRGKDRTIMQTNHCTVGIKKDAIIPSHAGSNIWIRVFSQ